ncbi:MAG: glucose 1-dehydrogenase [Alphaproteobacteria bacterium]|nr:glucose 1-dehydrogenase [Alphaproteobacteria bacterium]
MAAKGLISVDQLFRVDGEVALITGGGSGFGRVGAFALAEAGAAIAVTDIDLDSARRVAADIEAAGGRAVAFRMDVADRAEVRAVIAEAAALFGGIHILLNSAGIVGRGPTEDLADETWDRVMAVNQTGVFLCSREAGRHMLKAGRGSIINISSIMGLSGGGLYPHLSYHATKGALVNMTRALAVEWAKKGVRVNAIAPTFFRTGFGKDLLANNAMVKAIEDRTPMGRLGDPRELAGGILYLASPASSMVTGHTLAIDGGWLAI